MKTAHRYPKLATRVNYRDLADEVRRAEGMEVPESDNLDILRFMPYVEVLFWASVAGCVALVLWWLM